MICKCKNCGSAVKFDPTKNKMVCEYCDSEFDAAELDTQKYIEYNVYSCSACGGELRLNGVEASTFCPYCGQPTIAYSRVTKEVQPDVIIPFSVTKEEAIAAVRKKLKNNIFVPREIKHFDIEKVRGIYIPFWLYDAHYEGKAIIRTKHGSSKHRVTHYHYRHGECDFTNITADASKRLTDESSQRLEPYHMDEAVPFNMSYLSGFYADKYDVEDHEVENIIRTRAREYYESAMLATVSGDDKTIDSRDDIATLGESKYAFLPAWFLTFRYKDKPYTFLINGQTKKVVGAVPFVKPLAGIMMVAFTALLYYPAKLAAYLVLDSDEPFKGLMGVIFVLSIVITWGIKAFSDLDLSNSLTTSSEVKNMVSEREEEH